MQDIGKEEQETAETEVSEQGVQEVPGTTPQDGTEPVADRARRLGEILPGMKKEP